jgi:hypothetical protein
MAWRGVGLDMLFVFDGTSLLSTSSPGLRADLLHPPGQNRNRRNELISGAPPPEKQNTILARFNENITSTQLFYATSPASRSTQSFSRNSANNNSILPPFCSHVFIQALHDLDIKTHFVPLGEADGVCAVLAERLGSFVMGQDSDFVILMGEGGGRGYVPFDGLSWFEGSAEENDNKSPSAGGEEFTTVSNTKIRRLRESPLLPPPDYTNPTLNLTYYPPSALRVRLRIPSTVLPLFASLCGTDYTPLSAAYHFFEPSQNLVSRIEKVARILREQLYSPNVNKVGTAGDHAADLVTRVIKKLLVRPFYTESEGAALVDAMVDSTLQYTLPTLGRCCEYTPFCGVLDEGCQSESVDGVGEGIKRFSKASERGEFRAARQGYFYPGSIFPYQVLEDPGRGSLKAGGLMGVRKVAWEILDEALGLRFVQPDLELELASSSTVDPSVDGGQGSEDIMDLEKPGSDSQRGMTLGEGSQTTLVESESSKQTDIDPSADTETPEMDIDLQSNSTTPTRIVTEHIRSSNRITPHTITLDHPTDPATPRALQPLQDRLRTYLTPFHASTPLIISLPTQYQPIIAIIRFCILDSATWVGHEQSWRHSEIEAVLKSCLGTYAQWCREANGDVPSKKELEMSYPLLTSRNAQIVAHLKATETDSLILAEALLLSDHDAGSTHLQVYKFYSGQTLHTFLNKQIPEGWKWRESDQATYGQCWEALVDGIEDKIAGFTPTTTTTTTVSDEGGGVADEQVVEVPEREVGKKRKKSKSKGKGGGGGGKTPKPSGGGGGRFDLLSGLDG